MLQIFFYKTGNIIITILFLSVVHLENPYDGLKAKSCWVNYLFIN
jgi:hypothetical protein